MPMRLAIAEELEICWKLVLLLWNSRKQIWSMPCNKWKKAQIYFERHWKKLSAMRSPCGFIIGNYIFGRRILILLDTVRRNATQMMPKKRVASLQICCELSSRQKKGFQRGGNRDARKTHNRFMRSRRFRSSKQACMNAFTKPGGASSILPNCPCAFASFHRACCSAVHAFFF